MANFQMRDIDDEKWGRFATRAQMEGWPMRELLLTFVEEFGAGRLNLLQLPPMRGASMRRDYVMILKFTCPKCNKSLEVDCWSRRHPPELEFYPITCPHCHDATARALPGDVVAVSKPGEMEARNANSLLPAKNSIAHE